MRVVIVTSILTSASIVAMTVACVLIGMAAWPDKGYRL